MANNRNKKCHCGSGKKYKHCCQEKDQLAASINQIKQDFTPMNQAAYSAFTDVAENRGEGDVPTMMEFLGKPNHATEVVKEIHNEIGKTEFSSIEELTVALNAQMAHQRSRPLDDFFGLSPAQMQILLSSENPFNESTELISWSEKKEIDVSDSLFIKIGKFILTEIAATSNGLKLTAKGNLPRIIVEKFVENLGHVDRFVEYKRTIEDEFPILTQTKVLLQKIGYTRKTNGKLHLTKKGLSWENNFFELSSFKDAFLYFGNEMEWGSNDRFRDLSQYIQRYRWYGLYLLSKFKKDEFLMYEYVDVINRAFPKGHFDDGNEPGIISSFPKIMVNIYLFGRYYQYFGLLDCEENEVTDENKYRTSQLFNELFDIG